MDELVFVFLEWEAWLLTVIVSEEQIKRNDNLRDSVVVSFELKPKKEKDGSDMRVLV
jgi:hypothetical protein